MVRLTIFHWLVGVVAAEVAVAVLIIGQARFAGGHRTAARRLRRSAPYVATLALVAALGAVGRRITDELAWLVGVNVTPAIQAIEGGSVAWMQSLASPPVTALLSFVYVYGFPFLLVFPLLLYLVVDDGRPFRELALAFALNDLIGLLAFVALISYGPRNVIPGLVEPLLFSTYPETRILSSSATANTNVFPSLHTSLSVTVAMMAWRTRGQVRTWWYLAAPLAAGVIVATMYLGIHWIVDVLGGLALGVGSVRVAALAVDRRYLPRLARAIRTRSNRPGLW